MRRFLWLALLLLMMACTPTTETAVSTPSSPETAVQPTATFPPPVITAASTPAVAATAVPATTEPVPPTPTAVPEPTVELVAETGVQSGRTDEGAFFLGDPNAPITHLDYSDFL